MKYYVDFSVDPDDYKSLLANLLYAVHGANKSLNAKLCIAFPDWLEEIKEASGRVAQETDCGTRLRVFGEQTALEDFIHSAVPLKFKRSGMVFITKIKLVPSEIKKSVRFIRDRTHERGTEGQLIRRSLRRERRQTGEPVSKNDHTIEVRQSVKFEMVSKSSDVKFPIYVSMLDGNSKEFNLDGEASSYGLSVSVSQTTPMF